MLMFLLDKLIITSTEQFLVCSIERPRLLLVFQVAYYDRKVAEGLQLNVLFLDSSESVMYQLNVAYPTVISLSFTRIFMNLLRLTLNLLAPTTVGARINS